VPPSGGSGKVPRREIADTRSEVLFRIGSELASFAYDFRVLTLEEIGTD